ncbi:15053_t:CDS:2, partial [Dentiscutata heterogama]
QATQARDSSPTQARDSSLTQAHDSSPIQARLKPVTQAQSPLLEDFDDFIGKFETTFGDSDKIRTAATRIRKLTQGSKSASSYTSEFRQISSNLDWGKVALIDQFLIGLKNNMKDLLLTMKDSTSLNDTISKAGDLVTNYSRSSLTPEPIQIDSTRARTFSEEEKQRHGPIISAYTVANLGI